MLPIRSHPSHNLTTSQISDLEMVLVTYLTCDSEVQHEMDMPIAYVPEQGMDPILENSRFSTTSRNYLIISQLLPG